MKKVLLALPLLAIAALFTYCTKSDVAGTLSGGTLDNPVSDRCGTLVCTLNFTTDNLNLLNVCGVLSNTNNCATCTGQGKGAQNIRGFGQIQVTSCNEFSITNNNNSSTWISFDGGNTFFEIPANDCVTFTTDGNCVVSIV